MIPFPAVVDSSMFATFKACPQKFFRSSMEHWKGKGESIHLHAGKAFADGLEAARRAFYEQELDAESAIEAGGAALMESYGDFQPGEGEAKTLDRMLGALVFYFDVWPLERNGNSAKPHVMPSGKLGIEFSFAEPLGYRHPQTGDPIIYCGRADMISDYADGLYIQDEKTTSQLGASWSRKWDLRSQFIGYTWAAKHNNLPVNGVLVRGVSILKTKYDKAEAITNFSLWEVERWYNRVLRDLARMEDMWRRTPREGYNAWDYDLDEACTAYGGCQFTQVCKSPEPESWLPMYFERRKWDPLTRTETLLLQDSPEELQSQI